MIIEQLDDILRPFGLSTRGALHAEARESIPSNMATLILIGNKGPDMWRSFSANIPEDPNPLDTWTKQILVQVANSFDALAIYPFEGPPHYPFQRWAMMADDVAQSPIGPLIHPVYGMWHAYRAAFLFKERLDIPDVAHTPSPCTTCADQPCLKTCPVSAFRPGQYDVAACRDHIASEAGRSCLENACLARRACPVGREYIYQPAQAAFHMQHFLRAGQSSE
ncbi:ferredoxin [Thalassospiraceae bacterium LMO-JJ14]|nr:ferredoxin [Thalassospiraceae bacterium LMO-JJ14]